MKELYAKAQEAQPAAEPGQETPEPPVAEKEPDKDTFSIYQLKRGDETRDYRFEPYDRLQAAGLSVEAANYDLIYTAPLAPDMTLEDISVRFNIDHPKDFKGHSLSTSDVVVLHQNGQDTAHYADSYGYREVPEFLHEQTPQLTPDTRMTGEQIRTPRGSFSVTDMTAEQMKEAGYGFHHTSEDGKYLIMGNGTQAFAVAAEQPEKANPLKHVEDAIEQNDNNFDGIINFPGCLNCFPKSLKVVSWYWSFCHIHSPYYILLFTFLFGYVYTVPINSLNNSYFCIETLHQFYNAAILDLIFVLYDIAVNFKKTKSKGDSKNENIKKILGICPCECSNAVCINGVQ